MIVLSGDALGIDILTSCTTNIYRSAVHVLRVGLLDSFVMLI